MFAFLLFLAVLAICIWVLNRLNAAEQRLTIVERALADLRAASRRAHEGAPATAAPPEPAMPPEPPRIEAPQPVAEPVRPRDMPPPEPAPVRPQYPPEPPRPRFSWKLPEFDWESLVGVKLFSWIAGIALLLAAVFFLRYSVSQGWLNPPVRMAIGVVVGIALLVLCELKAARRYPVTANAMDASAIAILFATFFAARALWNLIGAVPAFLLLVLVTAVAVLLAVRRDSIFIALLGLLGGFATPALLSTGENRPISLFSYILLLNAGLAWVALRKNWPLLTTLSLVFTVVYQWGWVMKFLTASQLPIAMVIFLVFPILGFAAVALRRRDEVRKSWVTMYGQAGNIGALLPLLFALYVAAVPGYGGNYGLLFGFLFLLDAGLLAVALARGPETMHLAGGVSTILVWAIWLASSYSSRAWPAIAGFVLLFSLFYLAAPRIARRYGKSFPGPGRHAVFAAPLLLFALPCLAAMEPGCASPWLLFGTLLLALVAVSVHAVREEAGALYAVGAVMALLTEAVWSLRHLTPERLVPGLAVYAVFGLLYIGVPVAAQRLGKRLKPEGAGAALILLSLALLFFLATGPVAQVSIWGIALLLLVLNAGLYWQGAACRIPALAVAGMILSWIILGLLWASVPLSALLIPALAVVAGFATLVLAANVWLQRQTAAGSPAPPQSGVFLGLAGHAFLVAVAANAALGIPPWPLLGVLFLLDLAAGAAALYLRRENVHRAAMAASGFLLIVWVDSAEVVPWPDVAVFAAGALVLFALLWIYLAKRIVADAAPYAKTAAVTAVFAQFVTIFAAAQRGTPGVGFLLTAHLLLLAVLLGLEWYRRTYAFAVIAVLPTALAVAFWASRFSAPRFWPDLLLFALPVYLVFILYPIVLGRRAGRSIGPCLAAVLAGVPFFFEARLVFLHAGWDHAIGLLPLGQALLLSLVLMRLLKIEPAGARQLGRLALVAGAALAFVTVAIPLQLEKEWITIGWALEAAALAWLYGKIPHRGLLYFSGALFAAVFVRLSLNPSIFVYQPRSGIRIWNWYLYTYLAAAASMILGSRFLSRTKDALAGGALRLSRLLPPGAVVLLFLLLNIEIADFFSTGKTIAFRFSATLAQDLTYTLGWAAFAVSLLAAGILLGSQAARVASLALLVVTIFKCFFHDLARLGGLYRVASFVGLAVCLALVALVLQKFVLSARKGEP